MLKSSNMEVIKMMSLSARRAWIEMIMEDDMIFEEQVALRKESVDRNANPGSTSLTFPGRSPQGERG